MTFRFIISPHLPCPFGNFALAQRGVGVFRAFRLPVGLFDDERPQNFVGITIGDNCGVALAGILVLQEQAR